MFFEKRPFLNLNYLKKIAGGGGLPPSPPTCSSLRAPPLKLPSVLGTVNMIGRGVRGPILTTLSANSTILEHAWNNSADPHDPPDSADPDYPPDSPETVAATAGRTLPTTRAGGQDDGS